MHFHLPKPLHGWREFIGEVGIIVLGILIALGGEQLVEKLHWRDQVAATRESLNGELAEARFNAAELIIQHDCIKRRLDALDELTGERSGLPPVQISLFELRPWTTSTWDSAAASGATAHMEIGERNRYATFFGVIKTLAALHQEAFELSADVSTMTRHQRLTDVSRDRLQADLARLRALNWILFLASQQLVDRTEPLNLQLGQEDLSTLARDREVFARCAMPTAGQLRGVS
jgi:hypothetical protein